MDSSKKSVFIDVLIILLLLIITLCGVTSFNAKNAYEAVNQYGEVIKIWGSGLYAHDSFFKAPIFIGTDFTSLLVTLPLLLATILRRNKTVSIEYEVRMFALMSILLYYSASICFGVTYNYLHLIYIFLFGLVFYRTASLFLNLHAAGVKNPNICTFHTSKGMRVFLVISGISLFVAWLPDIITSLINKKTLDLIEVYTTEVTYILDMGIISPLMYIALYLSKRENFIGYVLLRMIFLICMIVGIMLPIQTAFQIAACINIPLPVLITKVFIFVILAVFSFVFNSRLKKETKYSEE